MGRVRTSWRMTRKSWQVIRADGSLLAFPLMACVAGAVLLAAWIALGLQTGLVHIQEGELQKSPEGLLFGAAGAYLLTCVSLFFQVALASCAVRSFAGEDTRPSQGLRVALQRIPQILGWAVFTLTVNWILSSLQRRSGMLGRVVFGGADVAWRLACMFVVTIIAVEGEHPAMALRRSATMFRRRWGEGMGGNVIVGLLMALAMAGTIAVTVLLWTADLGWSRDLRLGATGGMVLLLVMTLPLLATLNQLFVVALYLYSQEEQQAPPQLTRSTPFASVDFQEAFRSRDSGWSRA